MAQRFALNGDVAVGMHPVTAPGYNFGLQGMQVLAMAERAPGVNALIKSAITRQLTGNPGSNRAGAASAAMR